MITCAFCRGAHRIDFCDCELARDWAAYAHDLAAFSMNAFENMDFLKSVMHVRQRVELKVLGYKLGLKRLCNAQSPELLNLVAEQLFHHYPSAYASIQKVRSMHQSRFQTFCSYMDTFEDIRHPTLRLAVMAVYRPKRCEIKAFMPKVQPEESVCECSICLTEDVPISQFVTLNCGHAFCVTCYRNYLQFLLHTPTKKPECALCRCRTKKAFMSVPTYNQVDSYLDISPVFNCVDEEEDLHPTLLFDAELLPDEHPVFVTLFNSWSYEDNSDDPAPGFNMEYEQETRAPRRPSLVVRAFNYIRGMFQ